MSEVNLKDIYLELFALVRSSLTNNINKDRIVSVITKVCDAFIRDNYNELLLYSYTPSKHNYLMGHITNNVIVSVGFGASLRISNEDLLDLGICAFCHDFGMAEYTDLFQRGHEFSPEETKLIQRHPIRSAELFRPLFSEKIINGILDVHENVNGTGYPNAKSGFEISFLAKIISICDVFVALTHPRNFRKEFNPYEAMKIIIEKIDIMFEKKVVKRFLEFMSIYPVGSLVYLNTGETAIVIASNKGFPTRSVVRILLNAKQEVDKRGKIINLLEDNMVYIVGCLDYKQEKEILHYLKPRGDIDI